MTARTAYDMLVTSFRARAHTTWSLVGAPARAGNGCGAVPSGREPSACAHRAVQLSNMRFSAVTLLRRCPERVGTLSDYRSVEACARWPYWRTCCQRTENLAA